MSKAERKKRAIEKKEGLFSDIDFSKFRRCRRLMIEDKNLYYGSPEDLRENTYEVKDVHFSNMSKGKIIISYKRPTFLFYHNATHAVLILPDGVLLPGIPLHEIQILS